MRERVSRTDVRALLVDVIETDMVESPLNGHDGESRGWMSGVTVRGAGSRRLR